MNKHTPGPWRIVQDRVPASLEVYAGKTAIAECWRRADVETEIANARLIAAAPELLVALQLMVDRFIDTEGSYGVWENEAIEAARATIEKATGGEG